MLNINPIAIEQNNGPFTFPGLKISNAGIDVSPSIILTPTAGEENVFNATGINIDTRFAGLGAPNLLFMDASAHKIGIGTNSPSYELHITQGQAEVKIGSLGVGTAVPDADSVGIAVAGTFTNNILDILGLSIQVTYAPTSVVLGDFYGTDSLATTSGSQNMISLFGHKIALTMGHTGSTITGTGLYVQASTTNSAVTTLYGVRILTDAGGGGSITTEYGLKIEDVNGGSTAYAIYTGAGPVRLGDSLTLASGKSLSFDGAITFTPNSSSARLTSAPTLNATYLTAVELTPSQTTSASTSFGLDVRSTINIASGVMYSARSYIAAPNTTGNVSWAAAHVSNAVKSGAGTIGSLIGEYVVSQVTSGSGDVTVSYGLWLIMQHAASSTVNSQNAIYISAPTNTGGGTINNLTGIRILDINVGVNNWAIRTDAGNIVFNEGGDENTDVRIETNTLAYGLFVDGGNNNVSIGAISVSANYDLGLFNQGVLALKETTTPTADTNYGKIYTKSDNKLYFQDGAGTEHEIAFV
jgi:hypothetical protein